jgi:Domain of unknown function (DUF4440)/Domain of unknown function (DUF3471)
MTRWIGTIFLLVAFGISTFAAEPRTITEQELVRRTQELYDAIVPGNQEPWKKYFADDALFHDEKGRSMDKTALIKDITPLPKGYSGEIKVVRPESRIIGDAAILSYDTDETEVIFGQHLTARYHVTDTWIYRNSQWQIVASQAFRYYEDPAIGQSDPKLLDGYVGEYELAPGITIKVTRDGNDLYAERTGRSREQLFPETEGLYFRKGVEGRRLFHVAANGTVDSLIDRRNNEDVVWKKIR